MKTRSQKLISLVLVLVMLVTMIPAGFFSASAEDVVSIANAIDWAAAAGTDLAGKTVKLTANISGVTAPLADTFDGTFDGQGFAIQDSTVAGNGVIANTLAGGATVQNVKFANVDLTGTGTAGMIAGTFTAAGTGETTTITKVTVDAASSVTGVGYTGGLFGTITAAANYTLAMSNILMQGAVSGGNTGGIAGFKDGAAANYQAYATLTNAVINPTAALTGGIYGFFNGDNTANAYEQRFSRLDMTNVVVAGAHTYGFMYASARTFNYTCENVYVTSTGNLSSSAGYASYANGVLVARIGTADQLNTAIGSDVITVITAKQAAAAAQTDANGILTGVEVTEEPLDLTDYDNTSLFTVKSVADWNAIATSGKNFAGKTIQLGADIDFKNAAAAPLVPASLGATTMKFDGKGFAIKNATASAPLIAGILTGTGTGGNPGTGTEFSAATSVKDVTFEKITMTAEGDIALVAGTLNGNSMDFLFENIKVVDCDITSTAGKAAAIAAVQEYGAAGSFNPASVKAANVTVDAATTITAKTFAAGILAHASGVTNSMHVFENVYVAATITSNYAFSTGTAAKYDAVAAGILGYVAGSTSRGVTLSFTNCVVAGSLLQPSATDTTHGAIGGLFGMVMGGNAKVASVTVSNVGLNLASFTNVSDFTAGFGTVNNSLGFVSVYDTAYTKNAPTYEYYDIYGKMYNGSESEENLVTGSKKNLETKQLFKAVFDNDGFLTSLIEVDPSSCQHEWSDWDVTTPATGFETGLKQRTCTICDFKESEVIPEIDFTTEELLEIYDSTSIFVINSAAEWNAVAASGKNFAGKTIMLGADIDFENAVALPLVPASLGATTMKFDGQGHKIMNATASAPLLAGVLTATGTGATPGADATTDCESELADATTIKNVILENITMTATGDVALLVGTLTGNSMDYKFSNIKVVNCDITSTEGSAAALFVTHERGTGGSFNRSVVSIKNVTVDADTTITAYNHAAGVFVTATQATNTAMVFVNVYVAATITSTFEYIDVNDPETPENESQTHETTDGNIGGLVAVSADPGSRTVHYYFKNVAVVGSLFTTNGTVYDGRLGGLLGYAGGVATFTMENVVVDLADYSKTQNYRYSIAMMQKAGAIVSYKNLFIGNAPTAEYMNGNGSALFAAAVSGDANFVAGGTAMNLPNVATMNAARQATTIIFDEDGFIVKIKDTVRAAGYQASVPGSTADDKYAIRFVGLSQLADLTDTNNVHMKIVATTASGTRVFDTSSENCFDGEGNPAPGAKLYNALTVHSQYNVTSEIVFASDYDANSIVGFTIFNVPKEAITFSITIRYTNAYGVEVESAPLELVFDANGNGPKA